MKDRIIEAYDRIVNEYVREEFNNPLMLHHYERFLKKMPAKARILDAGCGPGEAVRRFCDAGHDVVGIDLSRNMIEHARKLSPEATFYVMDIEDIRLDMRFDGIWATLVLCHVPNERHGEVFRRFSELLKPGGVLLLEMLEGKSEIIMPEIYHHEYHQYFVYTSQAEVEGHLQRNGFRLIEYTKELIDKQDYKFTISFFYAEKRKGP